MPTDLLRLFLATFVGVFVIGYPLLASVAYLFTREKGRVCR